jgi:hypothetical protein
MAKFLRQNMFPYIYYAISISGLIALSYWCLRELPSNQQNRLGDDTVFLIMTLLLLVFMRIPSLFFNAELNGDESQVIAEAMTLLRDPVYARSINGTTIGPLNSYFLSFFYCLGLPQDYTTARLAGLMLLVGSLIISYLILLRITSSLVSRLSLLNLTLFFGWTNNADFLHYSSELTSLLLMNGCFLLSVLSFRTSNQSIPTLVFIGIMAGLTPYCKLQAVPVVGVILLVLLLSLWQRYKSKSWPYSVALILGFVLPSGIVASLAYYFHVLTTYIDYALIGNLVTYSQIYVDIPLVQGSFLTKLSHLPSFFFHHPDFLIFSILTSLLTLTVLLYNNRRMTPERAFRSLPWPTITILVTTIAAFGVVIAPGTEFGHHLLLLIFPLTWLTAVCLQQILNVQLTTLTRVRLLGLAAILFLTGAFFATTDDLIVTYFRQLKRPNGGELTALLTPNAEYNAPEWLISGNICLFSFPNQVALKPCRVSQIIRQHTNIADNMAVWGWNSRYYVETRLPQGVSETHTQRSVMASQMQARYLQRYADELAQNQPSIFVDAVGRSSFSLIKTEYRFENFPSVATIIKKHYSLLAQVDDVRIYKHQKRFASQ